MERYSIMPLRSIRVRRVSVSYLVAKSAKGKERKVGYFLIGLSEISGITESKNIWIKRPVNRLN